MKLNSFVFLLHSNVHFFSPCISHILHLVYYPAVTIKKDICSASIEGKLKVVSWAKVTCGARDQIYGTLPNTVYGTRHGMCVLVA